VSDVVPLTDEPEAWPVHGSEEVWRGSAPFAVRRDQVSRPGHDEQFGRLVVEHPGAVVVLAVDEREQVLVLRQYRHPAGVRFVELPAGLLDVPGEDLVVAARRELREEALLVAEEWELLNTLYPSPGLSAERIDIFLARGLSAASRPDDFEPRHEEADMTRHWVPVDDLVEAVLARRLTDGPLALAVLTYALTRTMRTMRAGEERP
jgi:ADP-ribose pyrophosphatase